MGAMDVLTTAVEQGCGYWARTRNAEWSHEGKWEGIVACEFGEFDENGEVKEWKKVTCEQIKTIAVKILAGEFKVRRDIAAQFVGLNSDDEDVDADGADVAVQLICFGEIKYG